jgi:hypothetical protein
VWRVARPGDRGNVFLGLGLGPVHFVPEVGVMAKRPQPQGLLNAGRGLGLGTLSARMASRARLGEDSRFLNPLSALLRICLGDDSRFFNPLCCPPQ